MLIYESTISSHFQAVDSVVKDIEIRLKGDPAFGDGELRFHILFMLREILNNAVEHGNQFQSHKTVFVAIHLEGRWLKVLVTDQGFGAQIPSAEKVKSKESLESITRRNRGIKALRDYGFQVKSKGQTVQVGLDLETVSKEG